MIVVAQALKFVPSLYFSRLRNADSIAIIFDSVTLSLSKSLVGGQKKITFLFFFACHFSIAVMTNFQIMEKGKRTFFSLAIDTVVHMKFHSNYYQ